MLSAKRRRRARWGRKHERTPLLSVEDGDASFKVLPKDASVFTLVLLMPPLERKIRGHWCSWSVALAFALLLITAVLQMVLTVMAGGYILQLQASSQSLLLPDSEPGAGSRGALEKIGGRDSAPTGCCLGADCADDLPCCNRPGKSETPANPGFLELLKPGGSGAKGGKEGPKKTAKYRTAPICSKSENGGISCAPTALVMADPWKELDADGDGNWTVDEAKADATNLACVVGVSVEDVFRIALRGILRAQTVSNGKVLLPVADRGQTAGITRPHFEWWRGVMTICSATDPAQCGDLIDRGVFDGMLGNSSRRLDLDGALRYCQGLLSSGGLCEAALPSNALVHRKRSADACGAASYAPGLRHVNPFNDQDILTTNAVVFDTPKAFETMHSTNFRCFLFLVLVLWFSSLTKEVKDIIQLWDFLLSFPVEHAMPFITPEQKLAIAGVCRRVCQRLRARGVSCDSLESRISKLETPFEAQPVKLSELQITALDRPHHIICVIVAFLRTLFVIYLGWAGSVFILSNSTCMDLLLNALAIVFVFELDEFLWEYIVTGDIKEQVAEMNSLKFRSRFAVSGDVHELDVLMFLWGIVGIPGISLLIMAYHDYQRTWPMLEALTCACYLQGDRCMATTFFEKASWDQHWSYLAGFS
eukprot:CAMPEP_0170653232 /NCGR_PEP_ID=MMETSP0224-20130122/47301_1 /TAXON_ID=285029 /ORGANISM="Togula jolla, Strain CCCM 725" /LENGTH=647 /DNA_ID=CAMNT_0010985097 /DNA_START=97 /DNA_END=2041 /DNA_ORIENTATION=+